MASAIDASASAHGNSPLPYAWIRTFATVTAAPWTAEDRIAASRGVGVDRPGDQDAHAERQRHDDGQTQQSLGHEPLEEEPKRRHGVVGPRGVRMALAYPPTARPMIRRARGHGTDHLRNLAL